MEEMNGQVFSRIKNKLTALNKVQHGIKIFLFSLDVCVVYVCENACPICAQGRCVRRDAHVVVCMCTWKP